MPTRPIWPILRTTLKYSFFATATAIVINDNVIEGTTITGQSMSPTLSPDYNESRKKDGVLWKKWNPTHNLKRGDVVHFDNPSKPEVLAVKRVIALEGDTVILDKKRRPEATAGPETPAAVAWDAWNGKARVPPGHVWVEGDNRGKSHDSNYYGPISRSLINGKAIALYWPPSKFGARPWVGYVIKTKVIEGREVQDWTEGLPIELAEVKEPHAPP